MGNKNKKCRNIVAVRNEEPADTDRSMTPLAIHVPVVLIEDTDDQLEWINEPMDYSAAAQMQSIASVSGILLRILTVPLILPAADEVSAVSSDLDEITIEPIRVTLKTPTSG